MVYGRLKVPGCWGRVAAGKSAAIGPELGRRAHLRRSDLKAFQEKPRVGLLGVTVLKLTQVGGVSILRRSGEPWLRNSAKSPRNLGRRGASRRRLPRENREAAGIGPCDCLLKTQVSAKS